jgi:class 3 adenylate cyclase/tetratricopeptide (TPR) repeat protein
MREERKVVTALFADVVGSTQLTERLDPEDAREVLGSAVRRMVEAVEAFGGTVKDLAGDGILALFGAPVTHEDDAERAVRAGLRIARATEDGSQPPVRVAIETGLVVLGPVGAGGRVEYGATGDALNTAARLQSRADPGTVLVGEVTRRAVGDRFAFGQDRRLKLKGKSDLVSAFEVLGERRRTAAAASAPMVGRGWEFERASRLAERALAGEGGLLVAIGDPGIGKSRLVEEVRRLVENPTVTWLEGRCVSYGTSTPYLPIRDLIHDAIGLPSGEPVSGSVLRQRIRALGDDLDETVPYLAAVLGMEGDGDPGEHLSPETRRLRTLDAIRRLVVALVERGPTVVTIEDLHWADASTAQALERLLPLNEGRPLLFVLTTRSGDTVAGALSTSVAAPTEVVELLPLPREPADELVDSLAGSGTISRGLLERVTETAGGNPFFLSELIRSLLASGELEPGAEPRTIELPATIELVILARLDQLDVPHRDVVTSASVLGRTVALPLLERLIGSDPRSEADDLVRLRLFERDGRPDEVWFAHALIQEVAYESLLRRRRRELHATAAAAIEDLWPDRVEENLGILALHHRGAGDPVAAMRCHDLAARRAERVHAVKEALDHITASIDLSTELDMTVADREVAERFLARARVRARTGDAVGAREDLETVLAEPGIAPDLAMRAHDELGFVLAGAADYRAAVPHLEAALEAATVSGDATAQVSALSRLSIVDANRLDFDAALEHGERALRSAEAAGDERAEASAMDALKQVALETGDVDTLERLADRLAEIHRRNEDLWLLQFAVFEPGYAELARMRLDRAFAAFEDALAINRRIGDVGNEPLYVAMLGRAHRGQGGYDEALRLGRRAFGLARELRHSEWTAWTAAWLGSTLMEVGALNEASGILAEGTKAAEASAADLHLVRCLGMGAWAAQRLGMTERALALADRATSILQRIRIRPPRAYVAGQDAYVAVARVRLARGQPDLAADLVAPIVTACRACGWSDGIMEGSMVLADAALRRGDAAGAVEAAEVAVAEAVRNGLPTLWRAYRGAADAARAARDEERAVAYASEADRAFARVVERIHDRELRDTFASAATSGPSSEGVER